MVGASKSETGGGGPIRYGMVGGGQGAFIGAVHRIAARADQLPPRQYSRSFQQHQQYRQQERQPKSK